MIQDQLFQLATLVVRQTEDPSSGTTDADAVPENCNTGNDYDGRLGVRISSIFVILVGSFFGAWFPVFARRHRSVGVPEWAFFIAKYFGSGVIIATAFIHLLAPANEALLNPCLGEDSIYGQYPWVEGIALMTIMVMFFIELMTMRYAKFGQEDGHAHDINGASANKREALTPPGETSSVPGEDHLGHSRAHPDTTDVEPRWLEDRSIVPELYTAQLTAVFILEFGVIFHSIFIGLTLAVTASDEFNVLYVVLVFHQTFEGLGLGSRLSMVPWPQSKRWTPYLLAIGYSLSTPIAIAIGLGARESFSPESTTTLVVNGVFDSISAGILIYTGLVELMAHEFMFSPSMSRAPIKTVLSAMLLMYLGAGLMALLGKWA